MYDMTRFPNGWSNDRRQGNWHARNLNDAIGWRRSAHRISRHSSAKGSCSSKMMTDTANSWAAKPHSARSTDNTSAIIAVQNATVAPLELTKCEFYRFTEDRARISRYGRALRRAHARSSAE